MSVEEPNKFQNTVWWITSIAISVVCCSVLFILFASYLVQLKTDISDTNLRINAVEDREDKILADIEMLGKRVGAPPPAPLAAATPEAPAPNTAEAAPAPEGSAPVSPPTAPSATPETPAPRPPTVSVPPMPAAPEKQ